jgi:sugar phosphate isomerase/epimerase
VRWTFATIVLVPRGEWGKPPSAVERRRVFEWAARTGFEGIELSPRWLDFHEMGREDLRALRSEVAAAGLRVSSLNINRSIVTRTDQAPEHRARLKRGVEVAEALGAEVLILSLSLPTLPGPDRPPLRGRDVSPEEFARSADFVRGLAEEGRRAGVALSIELHDDGLLDTPELCLRFLELVGAPNAGVNPDLGNICRGPGPLPDWEGALRLLSPRANSWGVKNYRAGRPVPVWEGEIDYARAFAILRDAGYRGWVAIESYFGNVLELQERSLGYLQRLLEETCRSTVRS